MKKIMEKLNKHFFPLLVVAILLVGTCIPVRASAAWAVPLDYTDLDYSVKFGTDINVVRFQIPEKNCSFEVKDYFGSTMVKKVLQNNIVEISNADSQYNIYVYPASTYGLSLTNMPVGSKIVLEVKIDNTGVYSGSAGNWAVKKGTRYAYFGGETNRWITNTVEDITDDYVRGDLSVPIYNLEYLIEDIEGADTLVPFIKYENFEVWTGDTLRIEVVSAYVEMEVSAKFWSQFQAQQNGKLLNDMVNGTDEQHAIVNDSVQGMQQAGSKLDGLGEQLNSVEKPDVDYMDVSADKLLGGMAATTMLTAPVREIWKNPVALSILTVVVTIVLISWVFFGKK